jgi:Mg2+/citrate symporter
MVNVVYGVLVCPMDFVRVKDAFKYGIAGVIVDKGKTCVLTIFHMAWSQGIQDALVSDPSTNGSLTTWI